MNVLSILFYYLRAAIVLGVCLFAPNVEASDEILQVVLNPGREWQLTFNPNGSAVLAYGSNGFDITEAPANSFSVGHIVDLLTPKLNKTYTPGNSLEVNYVRPKQQFAENWYISGADREIVIKLALEVMAKAIPLNKDRFEMLLAKHPFYPIGDKDVKLK